MFVALCVVATATAYGYVTWRFGQVDVVPGIRTLLGQEPEEDPGDVMNVLVVGSDSRADIEGEDKEKFDDRRNPVTGQRSDTIMILHVDPKATKAAILSIPRDLWVPIAGTKGRDGKPRTGKINTAFEGKNGPANLIKTIQDNLDIDIDHYIQVDFNGFRSLVDTVGGVPVYFPAPARDKLSGLRIEEAGCVKLDGEGALAYVRSRNYQYLENGRWRSEGGIPDYNRIERQQSFIRRLMSRAIDRAPKNPLTANRLVSNAVRNVKKDPALGVRDVAKLALRFRSLDPSKVDMLRLPTEPARRNGADVLLLKQPEAAELIRQFKGIKPQAAAPGELPDILPSTVQVRVLNGSGVGGQASQTSQQLQQLDFQVVGTGNATRSGNEQTVIFYGSGQRDKARLLQAYVQGGATLQADSSIRGTDLVLVTGTSFAGIADPTTPPPSSTTTTSSPPETVPAEPQC